jgi:hypothetical protein
VNADNHFARSYHPQRKQISGSKRNIQMAVINAACVVASIHREQFRSAMHI